jgi:hypothetical protein
MGLKGVAVGHPRTEGTEIMATFEQVIAAIKQGQVASRDDGTGPAYVLLGGGELRAWFWGKEEQCNADAPPWWMLCDLLDMDSPWVLSVADIMATDWIILDSEEVRELGLCVLLGKAPNRLG